MMLRGHALGGSRRLNGHWQSGAAKYGITFHADSAGYLRGDEINPPGGVQIGPGIIYQSTYLIPTYNDTQKQMELDTVSSNLSKDIITIGNIDETTYPIDKYTWHKITVTPHNYDTHICVHSSLLAISDNSDYMTINGRAYYTSASTTGSSRFQGGDIFDISYWDTEDLDWYSLLVQGRYPVLSKDTVIRYWNNPTFSNLRNKNIYLTYGPFSFYFLFWASSNPRGGRYNFKDALSTYGDNIIIIPHFTEVQGTNSSEEQPFYNSYIDIKPVSFSEVLNNGYWI